jgi:hypothetical protein
MRNLQVGRKQSHLQSAEAKALVDFGRKKGWPFAVLGVAPIPAEPVVFGKWKVVPAHLDSSEIPPVTMQRIKSIFEAGFRPKGFVVVHELPAMLPTGADVVEGEYRLVNQSGVTIDVTSIFEAGLRVGVALGKLAITVTAVTAGIVVPSLLAVGSAILLDPILVAVTQDDIWVEVDRWLE